MDTDTPAPAPALSLPDDVLAAVLGGLPPRSLAASRCVCRAWRGLVDDRRLLLPHLLPHSVRGIFVNYVDHERPHFFSRPTPATTTTTAPRIDGEFSYVVPEDHRWWGERMVADHCNGLVLYRNDDDGDLCVCNPVTRRWVRLPLLSGGMHKPRVYLVFDPAVSLHYEVLVAALDLEKDAPPAAAAAAGDMEWPPARWTWHVFSSRTGRWRERVFDREGEAAGRVADMLRVMDSVSYVRESPWRYGAYWQGALYVHCQGEYVSRLSLSDWKYQVIKSPIDRAEWRNRVRSFLGRSMYGVYFAAICRHRLRVWTLSECQDQTEWVLKYDRALKPDEWWNVVSASGYQQIQCDGPWILDDYYDQGKGGNNVEWSSDDDDIIVTCDSIENENKNDGWMYPGYYVNVLGFDPYKEVIFLTTETVAVAYHLNSSRVQFLGILNPSTHDYGVYDSFVYTPCHSLRHRR